MNVVFCNKSLRFFDELRGVILAETFYPGVDLPTPTSVSQEATSQAEIEFRDWAKTSPSLSASSEGWLPRHTFRGEWFESVFCLVFYQRHYSNRIHVSFRTNFPCVCPVLLAYTRNINARLGNLRSAAWKKNDIVQAL